MFSDTDKMPQTEIDALMRTALREQNTASFLARKNVVAVGDAGVGAVHGNLEYVDGKK